MSKDGRISFIVVPDKKYYGKYDFSDFSHFEFHVLQKNIHKDKSSTSAHISP